MQEEGHEESEWSAHKYMDMVRLVAEYGGRGAGEGDRSKYTCAKWVGRGKDEGSLGLVSEQTRRRRGKDGREDGGDGVGSFVGRRNGGC